MPNSKSAKKRVRQNVRSNELNKSKKSALATFEKKFHAAIAEKDVETAKTLLSKVSSLYDKAAKTNLVHKNQANRKKARLHHELQAVSG